MHVILGNHEKMVLRGDNRYIHDRYLKGIVRKTRIRHEDLYGPDMALGRWLRTYSTALVINDILYTHGGMPPYLAEGAWSLAGLNSQMLSVIDMSSSAVAFDETARMERCGYTVWIASMAPMPSSSSAVRSTTSTSGSSAERASSVALRSVAAPYNDSSGSPEMTRLSFSLAV